MVSKTRTTHSQIVMGNLVRYTKIVYKVTQNGFMRWGAYNWVYLSSSLQGKYVGALEMGNGIWRVFF